jgi:hypothetical protein
MKSQADDKDNAMQRHHGELQETAAESRWRLPASNKYPPKSRRNGRHARIEWNKTKKRIWLSEGVHVFFEYYVSETFAKIRRQST